MLGRCLGDLDLVSCEQPTPIGPFPILQYVPDLVAHAGAGLSEAGRLRVLSTLSGLGVAAAVGAAWVVLRRVGHPQLRWVFLLAAISGPVLAYGSSTWGEMLAAALLTLLVAAALLPAHPALVGLAAFGAGLTKETGYPFVIGLALVSLLWARGRTGTSIRRHVLFGAAGVALALAVGSALNVLRFGTPRNAYYLDPALRTASPEKALELAAGLFVSPNGGIVLLLAACLGCSSPSCSTVAAVRVVRGVTSWREGWLPFALVALVLALTAGLATWWAPFGWWAWGPRLSLPWVFPLLLLVLAAFGATLTAVASKVLAPLPGFVAVGTLLVLVALPHIGFLWDPDGLLLHFFLRETAVCPGGGPPPTPVYYDCLSEQTWTRHPIWLDALHGLQVARRRSARWPP